MCGGGGPRGSPDAALLSWAAVPSCQRPFSHSGSPTVRTSAPVLCRPCLDQKNPGPRVSCWEVGPSAPAFQQASEHSGLWVPDHGARGRSGVCALLSPPGTPSVYFSQRISPPRSVCPGEPGPASQERSIPNCPVLMATSPVQLGGASAGPGACYWEETHFSRLGEFTLAGGG